MNFTACKSNLRLTILFTYSRSMTFLLQDTRILYLRLSSSL